MYSYRIEQAIRAASVLHNNQVRKGSAPYPYISHPFAVATLVADYTDDEDVFIAALLHDTVEDTDYTFDELQQDFGGKVRDLVFHVTEVAVDKNGEKYSWRTIKKNYAKLLKDAPEESLVIAAADKIHNMRSMIEEYYDDRSRFLSDFGGTLDDRVVVYQEISNVFNRKLKSKIINEFNHVFDEYKKFIEKAQKDEY